MSSYTFICTPEKEWYLKITTIEQLMSYWEIFNAEMRKAIDTIDDTREYGKNKKYHATAIQCAIGIMAQSRFMTLREAHDKIAYDTRNEQYKAISEGKTIYVNKKLGWHVGEKVTEQFVHKNEFAFPCMEEDKLKIEQFPMGKHFYVFIDGVQLRKDNELKFDTEEEAEEFARQYLKTRK